MATSPGRDLQSVVEDIQTAVRQGRRSRSCRRATFVEYGGQFEAQQQANLRLLLLGSFAIAGIFLLLYKGLGSWQAAAASHGEHSACGDRLRHRPVAGQLAGLRCAAGGDGLALADSIWIQATSPFRRPLGGLHHAGGHRLPQRHYDDFALHPPDAVRRRGIQRAHDHSRQPGAARSRAHDRVDRHHRSGAACPGGGPNRQGNSCIRSPSSSSAGCSVRRFSIRW